MAMQLSSSIVQAQDTVGKSAYINPYKLEVTYNKTTHLVFPATVTSIDRGSEDILVQKATGVENIVKVKADKKGFEETNLSVITDDGKLYSFVVHYVDTPAYLNINVAIIGVVAYPSATATAAPSKPRIIYTQPVMNTENLKFYADKVKEAKSNISKDDDNSKVSLELNGIYIKGNSIFFRLLLENKSNVDYGVEQFRWYIRDNKQGKRTAVQETEIEPLYIQGDTSGIKGKTKQVWVVVLPKFTIPDGKHVVAEMLEQNGGRQLQLKIKNRHVIKARSL